MMTLMQASKVLHASLVSGGAESFLRVATDSRHIQAKDLFVALRGQNFDGHDFVEQAIAQGAVGAIVDMSYPVTASMPVMVVKDTTRALGQLAHYWRKQMQVKVLAITGSSGKTTVKEMLATILREAFGEQAVLATKGNFNNHIGLPLTLLALTPLHRFAVIEMGMSDFGEIRYLTELTAPDVAMVNNAQGAHLAQLQSVEGVARAKAEIFEGLSDRGIAVINVDDPLADIWRQVTVKSATLSFGLAEEAAVYAKGIRLNASASNWTLVIKQAMAPVYLRVPGLHNIQNALAAAAMASTCELDIQQICQGLGKFAGVKGRLNQKVAFNGAVLIDDTYNANPGSIRAAIDVLSQFPAPRLLILGDIGEVGINAEEIHRALGIYAQEKGIERLLAFGKNMYFAARVFTGPQDMPGEHFNTIEALIARTRELMQMNSTVLIKGSRFMRMERVVIALEAATAKNVNQGK